MIRQQPVPGAADEGFLAGTTPTRDASRCDAGGMRWQKLTSYVVWFSFHSGGDADGVHVWCRRSLHTLNQGAAPADIVLLDWEASREVLHLCFAGVTLCASVDHDAVSNGW